MPRPDLQALRAFFAQDFPQRTATAGTLRDVGARLAVVAVEMRGEGVPDTSAHANATCSMPPPARVGGEA